jgi:hypothetical protein
MAGQPETKSGSTSSEPGRAFSNVPRPPFTLNRPTGRYGIRFIVVMTLLAVFLKLTVFAGVVIYVAGRVAASPVLAPAGETTPPTDEVPAAISGYAIEETGRVSAGGSGFVDAAWFDYDGDGIKEIARTFAEAADDSWQGDLFVNRLSGELLMRTQLEDNPWDIAAQPVPGGQVLYIAGQESAWRQNKYSADARSTLVRLPSPRGGVFSNLVFGKLSGASSDSCLVSVWRSQDNGNLLQIYHVNGDAWSKETELGVPGVDQMVLGDLNGDGVQEVIVTLLGRDYAALEVYLVSASGFLRLDSYNMNAGRQIYSITTCDVNGDGIDELFTTEKDRDRSNMYLKLWVWDSNSRQFDGIEWDLDNPGSTRAPAVLAQRMQDQAQVVLAWGNGVVVSYRLFR